MAINNYCFLFSAYERSWLEKTDCLDRLATNYTWFGLTTIATQCNEQYTKYAFFPTLLHLCFT